MTNAAHRPAGRRRPVPDSLFGGRLADCVLLDLEVASVDDHAPTLRSIRFRSADLIDFKWKPGQDVMFDVPGIDPPTRRRYTIRRADAAHGTLDIDVVLHGDGPFARWAADASPGDRIDGIGPRGVVTLRADAAHHLLVGDETAIPVTLAMLEAVPASATAAAVLVVIDPATSAAAADSPARHLITWTSPATLDDVIADVDLPGATFAYVNGERSLVRSVVDQLGQRGLTPESMASKPYWRKDTANAAHGEPPKD